MLESEGVEARAKEIAALAAVIGFWLSLAYVILEKVTRSFLGILTYSTAEYLVFLTALFKGAIVVLSVMALLNIWAKRVRRKGDGDSPAHSVATAIQRAVMFSAGMAKGAVVPIAISAVAYSMGSWHPGAPMPF